MGTINEIIQQSAIGLLSKGQKAAVLSLFAIIVITLSFMLGLLLMVGAYTNVQYGF